MSISADQFKQGMRRLGGAVNIVTANHEGVWAGLTATAVTSLSAEPPRLLACVNRQGATYDTISHGRTLAVNVLGVEHKDLAMRFAGMTNVPETDRFDQSLWRPDLTGAPVLLGALVSFDCEVENIMDVGSHGIVIGNIKSVRISSEKTSEPLCYVDGEWAVLDILAS
jgi:flavin reductase (DIM6/NTAB) family NADH-FMN oxidoreductase RutF